MATLVYNKALFTVQTGGQSWLEGPRVLLPGLQKSRQLHWDKEVKHVPKGTGPEQV